MSWRGPRGPGILFHSARPAASRRWGVWGRGPRPRAYLTGSPACSLGSAGSTPRLERIPSCLLRPASAARAEAAPGIAEHKKPRGRSGHPVALVVARFPWGSVFPLRCGSLSAPLDVAQGALPTRLRHRRVSDRVPSPRPRPFAVVREGDDRRSYSLSSASAERDAAHRWTGAFSAPRMRTPRGPSRTLKSLRRIVSTSDAPIVTRRHTRVEIRFARCADRRPALADVTRS
jgi:hypothetical protein